VKSLDRRFRQCDTFGQEYATRFEAHCAMSEITDLHHVGHVVRDLVAAQALYAALGFTCDAPGYPALSRRPGEAATPFGAANMHATFARNFVEVLTVVDEHTVLPANARPIALEVPPSALAGVLATIERTIARISASATRFEGLHILVFETSDVHASALRLERSGVHQSGISGAQRPGDAAPIRVVEIEDTDIPEGRLALAESLPPSGEPPVEHPNGALELVESYLCVADAEIDVVAGRYTRYLGSAPRSQGPTRVFDLGHSSLRLVRASQQVDAPPLLPAFTGYAVTVVDLEATRRLLDGNGLPALQRGPSAVIVPVRAALGASVEFRQA
jgi:hypothetical protein